MAIDILVVDDEADIRLGLSGILEDEGFFVRTAQGDAEARRQVSLAPPSIILLDIWLQGSDADGIQLLKEFIEMYPNMPIIMMSGHGTIETAVKAIKYGAYDFVEKPFNADRMLVMIDRALEAAKLKAENAELKMKIGDDGELLGRSAAVNTLRQQIGKVAPARSRVLISGPPGSGKGLVAKLLHRNSPRRDAMFVEINCTTLADENWELELYGAAEGSQWGARTGLIEQAQEGTVLFDDIADLPLDAQKGVLRFLQTGKIQPLGGQEEKIIDARVVATTNRDLQDEVEAGTFREDLYFRINVVPMEVQGLLERPEDLESLMAYFFERIAAENGRPAVQLGADALAVMQGYSWPGNVRQLRNVAEWLTIMIPQDGDLTVMPDNLPPEILNEGPSVFSTSGTAELMSLPLRSAREEFERQYLEAQVLRFGGNITKTAAFIGMERSALHRKLRALNINSNGERVSQ